MSMLLSTLHQITAAKDAEQTSLTQDTLAQVAAAQPPGRTEQRVLINKATARHPVRFLDTAWARTITLEVTITPEPRCLYPIGEWRWLMIDPHAPTQIRGHQDDLTLILPTGELDIHENAEGYRFVAYRSHAEPGEETEIVTLPQPLIPGPRAYQFKGQREANRTYLALQLLGPYLDSQSSVEPSRGDLVVTLNPVVVLPESVRFQLYALEVWNQRSPYAWEI